MNIFKKVLLSGNWNNGVNCSSRRSNWNNSPLNLNSNYSGRRVCDTEKMGQTVLWLIYLPCRSKAKYEKTEPYGLVRKSESQ